MCIVTTVCGLLITVSMLRYITTVDDVSVVAFNDRLPQAPAPRKPILNPHSFRYLLNPKNICLGKDVFVITLVHSASENTMKRIAIRNTWGKRKYIFNKTVEVVFILGQAANSKMMSSVKKESDLYGDIVQEDFVETYRNLTYKAMAGLKWVSAFCRHAVYVLKTDDDVFVNTEGLWNYIKQTVEPSHGRTDIILCYLMDNRNVFRSKFAKWFVNKEKYSAEYYKPYCMGMAYVMSCDVTIRLYQLSFTTPFFWIDDYYVTGLLAYKLNVTHLRYNSAYHMRPFDKSKDNHYTFYFAPSVATLFALWNDVMLKESKKT